MPPETRRQKAGFVALGGLSVACIVCAGVLNSISQNKLSDTIQAVAENIKSLSGPANVDRSLSVDQILSAAAAKLIQQDTEIKTLSDKVRSVTHPSDALYSGELMVGVTRGQMNRDANSITFQLVVSGQKGLPFDQTLTYQGINLHCVKPGTSVQSGSLGVMNINYLGVRCDIIN